MPKFSRSLRSREVLSHLYEAHDRGYMVISCGYQEIVAAEVVLRSRHTVPNERGLIHRKRSLACKSQAAHAPLRSEEINQQ